MDYWLRKAVIKPGSQKDYHKYFECGRAIAVNCFFQSTAELDGPTLRDTFQWPPTSLWCAVLYVSRENGRYVRETRRLAELPAIHPVAEDPSMVTVGGDVASMDTVHVVPDPSQMRLSHVMLATSAFRHNAWTLEGFLQGVDLLHLVAVCKGLHVAF